MYSIINIPSKGRVKTVPFRYLNGTLLIEQVAYNLIEDRVTEHTTGRKLQCARMLLKDGLFDLLT